MSGEADKSGRPPWEAEALRHPCQRCRVLAGDPCVNYKGQRKATCSDRGRRPPPADGRPVQRLLFPPEPPGAYDRR